MAVQWSHCVLRVRDVDVMADFYCELFDFTIADRGMVGEAEIVFMSGSSSDHHQLAVMSGRSEDDASSLDHMAFRVDTVNDVKELIEKVATDDRIGDGFPVTHGNAVSVYFADPEGNGIEVFCDTPFHVQQPVVARWDPTQSDAEVLAGIESRFKDSDGFGPMTEYRSERVQAFGEA